MIQRSAFLGGGRKWEVGLRGFLNQGMRKAIIFIIVVYIKKKCGGGKKSGDE